MLIRNNDGEVAGEMNVSITQDGTVIRTNTMYLGLLPKQVLQDSGGALQTPRIFTRKTRW